MKKRVVPGDERPLRLDAKDMKLLALLRDDARMPVSIIAKRLRLNRDTVAYRMHRLESAGAIRKYYAVIDRSVFGYLVCNVFMLLDETDNKKQTQLIKELREHPSTEAVIEYNDRWDVQWTLVAKHLEELDDIIMKVMTAYTGVILERDTLVLVRWTRAAVWDPESGGKPDEKDVHILSLLSEDCRKGAVEIGRAIGLSSDAVIKRIKQLKDTGVIRRFMINVDQQRIGRQQYTIMLQMKQLDGAHQSMLKEFVHTHHQILRCVKTIGAWDIMMTLSIGESAEYHSIIKELKQTFGDIIKNYEGYMVYHENFITSLPRSITMEKS